MKYSKPSRYLKFFALCEQMKENTYKRLAFVNTILIKYNILTGVENLGLADCNKYYVSFDITVEPIMLTPLPIYQ